jgi:hypothetical protein
MDNVPWYAFTLVSEKDEIAAYLSAHRIQWNGSPETAPQGWEELQRLAYRQWLQPNIQYDTLAPYWVQKKPGISTPHVVATLFEHIKKWAKSRGFKRIFIPALPSSHRSSAQLCNMDISEFLSLQREDGLPQDPWIRFHIRAGGRMFGHCESSHVFVGTKEALMQETTQDLPNATNSPSVVFMDRRTGWLENSWDKISLHPNAGMDIYSYQWGCALISYDL